MNVEKARYYRSLFPNISEPEIQTILQNPNTMLYDAESIVPGYQDSLGDPKGFRPNTIENILIDAAVPGGWARLFEKRGRFRFPFATGGADLSDNLVKINFWVPPMEAGLEVPVAYWRTSFSRWQWVFPAGTKIGEILMNRFSDGALAVFEIRVRTRSLVGWENEIYRPFPTANDLLVKIQTENPQWALNPELKQIIEHLQNPNTLTERVLETKSYKGSFEKATGALDIIPDFKDAAFVKRLLQTTVFRPCSQSVWKSNGKLITYAASTRGNESIVPHLYDGGMLKVDNDSCKRCHDQAGRQIGNFQSDLVAYGELWGEDEIFSWHPFETINFVKSNGDVKNFNDDNRKIRKDFLDAGLVKQMNPTSLPNQYYKTILHKWKYTPFKAENNKGDLDARQKSVY